MKVALITGITGQDGAYLAEFLLSKDYTVHGIKRRSSSFNTERIDHLYQDLHEKNVKFILHYGDLSDGLNITRIIQEVQPDEIYNLGAMSHVKVSFESAEYTADVDGLGCLRILESIRLLGLQKKTKLYQASTSELYGKVQEIPQTEKTPFYPRSPYAVAKQFAFWSVVNFREAYNIFACNGILFNHESPLRGETFVTRKITRAVARMFYGLQDCIYMGNIDAQRDWGHAKEYVEAMWLMLQQENAEDFVIASNQTHTVRSFIIKAFENIGVSLTFVGNGVDEIAKVAENTNKKSKLKVGQIVLKIDPKYFRPTEVDLLIGDATKAKEKLGWEAKIGLHEIVDDMMKADLALFEKENLLLKQGYKINSNNE